jgi:uncharacterized protein
MPSATVRFYEELNDFLPRELRKTQFSKGFAEGCTVKALIEDLGVPHTEVDLVLVNGESVGFPYRLRDGDRLSVYPVFESWDIGPVSRVRVEPLRVLRFALDVHLGKLARLLRMMGFDSFYGNDIRDEELVRISRKEHRIVLSRDRGLLKRRLVTHGYLVKSSKPRDQLGEVIRRFDCAARVRMFGRCVLCNTTLERVEKSDIEASVPPLIAETYAEFSRCPHCGRVFWKGSHWERMKMLAEESLGHGEGSWDRA